MPTIERGVFVTDEFREGLREAAWQNRSSMSRMFGSVIDSFIADPDAVTDWPEAPPSGPAKLNASVDPAKWEQAQTIAHERRLVLSQVIRSGLARITLTSEGASK